MDHLGTLSNERTPSPLVCQHLPVLHPLPPPAAQTHHKCLSPTEMRPYSPWVAPIPHQVLLQPPICLWTLLHISPLSCRRRTIHRKPTGDTYPQAAARSNLVNVFSSTASVHLWHQPSAQCISAAACVAPRLQASLYIMLANTNLLNRIESSKGLLQATQKVSSSLGKPRVPINILSRAP